MKKLWSILLVFCILFSCFSPSVAFANQAKQENDKIEKLVKKGIIQGDEKGDLKFNQVITRSELVKIIVYSLGLEDLAKNLQSQKGKFPDVGTDHWANGVINVASTVKMPNGQYLINGFPDGQFKPENKITYQEFIKILVVATKVNLSSTQIQDAKWPDSYFNWAKELKIIGEGTGVENLTPSAYAIRNIVFNALYNALDKMEETKSKLKEESLRKTKENLRKGRREDKETTPKHTTSGSSNVWFGWWGSSSESSSSSGGSSSSGSTPSKPVTPAKEFTVSFNVNGGSGSMASVKVEKGKEYTLPANTFKPADGKEFKAWEVDGTEKQVGDKISINKDIEVKALWKEKEDSPLTPAKKFTISFNSNGGSGSMASVVVEKGKEYTLPANAFKPADGKEFKAWEVEGAEKQVGDKITINGDTIVKALWKEKAKPQPEPDPSPQPAPTPSPDKGKSYKIELDNSKVMFQIKIDGQDAEEFEAKKGQKINLTYFLMGEVGKGKEFDKFVLLKGNAEIKNATSKTEAFFIMPGEDVKIGAEVREKGSKPSPEPSPSPQPEPQPEPAPQPEPQPEPGEDVELGETVYINGGIDPNTNKNLEIRINQKFSDVDKVKDAILNFEAGEGMEVAAWQIEKTGKTYTTEELLNLKVTKDMVALDEWDDDYVMNLNPQFKAKGQKADKATLETKVESAKSLDLSGYTSDSANRLEETIKRAEKILKLENPAITEISVELFNLEQFEKSLISKDNKHTISFTSTEMNPYTYCLYGRDDYIEKWKDASYEINDDKKSNVEYSGGPAGEYRTAHYKEMSFMRGTTLDVSPESSIYIRVALNTGDGKTLKQILVNNEPIVFEGEKDPITGIAGYETKPIKIKIDKDTTIKTIFVDEQEEEVKQSVPMKVFIFSVDQENVQDEFMTDQPLSNLNESMKETLTKLANKPGFKYFYIYREPISSSTRNDTIIGNLEKLLAYSLKESDEFDEDQYKGQVYIYASIDPNYVDEN
ncbi:MAG: InlB B-repeat-containing protein [Peptoniphilus sp.]|uniref:InlB B-repeat-containing protein n=1 Tax=Peptoniphilus sp. TaxID=1971214 RepID=UPI002A757DA4|nr:InlB B-repeat-containing protein [Peptoniphilus sp.]MDY2987262.1 InlB B-repeat-containing protein [Peptoniphilus sp.]